MGKVEKGSHSARHVESFQGLYDFRQFHIDVHSVSNTTVDPRHHFFETCMMCISKLLSDEGRTFFGDTVCDNFQWKGCRCAGDFVT